MSTKARIGIGSILLLVVLTFIGICMGKAKAQTEDYPPGDDQIVPLAIHQMAPFEGQLFSTDTAIRWGFRLQSLRLQLQADVAHEQAICAAQTDLLNTKLQLAQDNTAFQLTTLHDQLAAEHQTSLDLAAKLSDAEDVPWYRTWTFGVAVGAVVTAGLIALSGWLISAYA